METYSICYNDLDETWEAFACDDSVPFDNEVGLNKVVIDIRPSFDGSEEKDYFVYVKCETIQGAFSEGSILIESAWPS